MPYKRMGAEIRRIRLERGLTQEKVAEGAEISVSFYGHIERGTRKMSVQTLYSIAMVLSCSADEILGTGKQLDRHISALRLLRLAESLSESLSDEQE